MSEITNTLFALQSTDTKSRQRAEQYLKELETGDFKSYINALCEELCNKNNPDQSVTMAGLLLKNAVDARGFELKKSLATRWFSIPEIDRQTLRQKMLQLLLSQRKPSRDAAALAIAKIATTEIPEKVWTDLADSLLQLAANAQQSFARAGAMRTIALLCEELPDYMASRTNLLFELLCKLLTKEQKDDELKREAIIALFHALCFADDIFVKEKSRNIVLSMLFECLSLHNAQIKIYVFDCLIRIAELFYQHLHGCISTVLQISCAELRDPNLHPALKLRAIEFWSALAEFETDLQNQSNAFSASFSARSAEALQRYPSQSFVQRSLSGLVPVLLEQMVEPVEGSFNEDGLEAGPAATCLYLVSLCTRDAVVPHVLPFIEKHVGGPPTDACEAAICAFGVIMEGPSPERLMPVVSGMFDKLLHLSRNESSRLRETASWALARVCKRFPEKLNAVPVLFDTLLVLLRDKPRVAANVCWAIYCLAEGAESNCEHNALTPYFDSLAEALLVCSKRKDRNEHKLLTCCYETLDILILTSTLKSRQSVFKLAEIFIIELKNSFSANDINQRNQVELNNLQALLIGSLSSIIKILPNENVYMQLDMLMDIFFHVLQSNDKTIYEEVLVAIGVIINKIQNKFAPYISKLKRFLILGLSNSLGGNVVQVSTGTVGDIFRSLGPEIIHLDFCDEFVQIMIQTLQNPHIERRVKPSIVTCFGDIALAINSGFDRYFDFVMPTLIRFSGFTINDYSAENVEFQNAMRQSLLETFSMILHSMRDNELHRKFLNFAPAVLSLIKLLVEDEEKDAPSVAAALAFIGDVIDVLGVSVKLLVENYVVKQLFDLGASSADDQVRKSFNWAMKCFNSLNSF